MLFYDKLDFQGHILERIEKFYPLPPESVCNVTNYGQFLSDLGNQFITPLSTPQNVTNETALQCCDFFSNGLGYQFTICDKGVGVYILSDRKGSEDDLKYVNKPLNETGFNDIPWNQLEQAVDQFCLE